jgi:hypothetical protein
MTPVTLRNSESNSSLWLDMYRLTLDAVGFDNYAEVGEVDSGVDNPTWTVTRELVRPVVDYARGHT